MEKEPRNRFPKGMRYPLFLIGLLVVILGELASVTAGAGLQIEVALGGFGFALLVLSVALR